MSGNFTQKNKKLQLLASQALMPGFFVALAKIFRIQFRIEKIW